MKNGTARILLWVFIAVMCLTVVSMPIFAANTGGASMDAVTGSRGTVHQLLSSSHGSVNNIYVSTGTGGTAYASATSSISGKTVTVSVRPDGGYAMASIVVITASGAEVQVLPTEDTFTFVMPGEAVVVDITFQYVKM